MKTFDKKDVYSWSNCEEARQYVGEEGYFCDDCQEDLAAWSKGLLHDVDQSLPVDCIFENEENEVFGLFLPADKVIEVEEKKYRAFKDFKEFRFWTGRRVGVVIVYRNKLTNDEIEAVITRSQLYENSVEIGAVEYTFKELFEQWEWLSDGNEWCLFGVEEKSKV